MITTITTKRIQIDFRVLAMLPWLLLPMSCAGSAPSQAPTQVAALQSIPGLTGDRAVEFLTGQGLSCSDRTTSTEYAAVWNCARGQAGAGYLQVEIAGEDPSAIRRITAVVSGPPAGIGNMRSSFSDVATVPYSGAQPTAAKAWAEENFDRGAQTRISGVAFVLAPQSSGAKALRMSVN
jgi:hypothetical protein